MLTLSLSALVLSVGCGLGFAASDYFRKAVPADCPELLLLLYFVGGQVPVLAAWLLWSGEYRLTADYWGPGLLDAAAGLAGNLLFIAAVRRSPLSLMIPILALVPVLTAAIGVAALGEVLTAKQVSGAALIFMGLVILFIPSGAATLGDGRRRSFGREPGLPLMLGTAVCWSVTPILDKLSVDASSVPVHGLLQTVALTVVATLWILARGGTNAVKLPQGSAAPIAGAALAAGIGYVFQLAAYMATLVAVVELIKRLTGVLSALIVGRVFFGEPLTRTKIIGIAVIFAGLPQVIFS